MSEHAIQVRLQQRQDYQFDIDFGGQVPQLLGDEPVPLGSGLGPSPVQLLAATLAQLDRVLGQFEAFCTVSQSVAQGIPLRVEVFDALGVRLK